MTTTIELTPVRPVGSRVLHLSDAAASRKWMRRRVDHLRFMDDRTVVSEMDLHIDLRRVNRAAIPYSSSPYVDGRGILLPLLHLDRHRHTAIEVFDSAGRQLARLDRPSERALVADGIAYLAAKSANLEIGAVREAALRVLNDPPPARDQQPPSRFQRWLRRVGQWISAMTTRSQPQAVSVSPHDRLIASLSAAGVPLPVLASIHSSLLTYESAHLLIVDVPNDANTSISFVLKLRFVASVPPKRRSTWLLIRRLLWGTLSLGVEVPVVGVQSCGSYHINTWAPRGFKVVDSGIVRLGGPSDPTWFFDDDRLAIAAHVELDGSDHDLTCKYKMCANFYANRTGLFLESWFLSFAVTLGLIAFTFHLVNKNFTITSTNSSGQLVDSNFAATLLLLFPSLAVTIVGQRNEHRLASRTYAMTRGFLYLMALASAACALPFVFEMDKNPAKHLWFAGAAICWLVAFRLTIGAVAHLWRVSRLRRRVVAVRRRIEALESAKANN